MSQHPIAIERKRLLVDWWKRQVAPTIVAANRATGIATKCIPDILAEYGIEYDHSHSNGESKLRQAKAADLAECLRPLWEQAYKDTVKERVFDPPRYPWREILCDDEHGLFLNPTLLARVIEREGGTSVGFNCFEVLTQDPWSRFRKTYSTDPTDEVAVIAKMFGKIDEAFEVKRVGRSNHTQRFVDFIANKTDNPNAVEAAKKIWKFYYEGMVNSMEHFQMVDTVAMQVGGFLMAHMRCYLQAGATTVERVKKHCEAQVHLGFKVPFSVVAQGHTHRLSDNGSPGYPCRLFESGCMCHVPEYALDPEKPMPCTTFTIQNGYARVTWDKNGNIDWSETRVVNLGVATVPEVK